MARISSRSTVLRLHLLGGFRIESAGHTLALPTRKMESLLAYLALHPGPFPRTKLAQIIWCDSSPEQARNSLRNALPALRRCVGEDFLIIDRETVQIAPTAWVDAIEFRARADAFLTAPSARVEDFEPRLYSGDLLRDFDEDWIVPEREHYRQLYLESLLKLTQMARAQSDYARAIECAQQVLENDPANEHAHQHLMFAQMALGNRDAALAQYETCCRALQTELDVEPMPETTALYEWICQSAPKEHGLAAGLTNLPIPSSRFVGRQHETAQVKAALAEQRLVTLTGAGGSGKTRLAIQVATDLLDRFRDGVWWVELGPLADASLVPQAVAKALGVRETSNEPISATLAHWIGERQMLLVLDNCEHLIAACAQLTEQWLLACPGLVILATSREGLGIYGEATYLVPPLSVPHHDVKLETLQEYEAIRLFVERAQSTRSDFVLTEQNSRAVAQICRHLDGIPLALELAAARVSSLPVDEIAARLGDHFDWLETSNPAAAPRQQTLRALIDWSYELLLSEEKVLFRRLAVFQRSGTLQAIEQVCSGEGITRAQVLDVLARLIDKSLLYSEEQNGIRVYRMLDTIRQYALDKLQAADETKRMRDRHLDYFLALAEVAEDQLRAQEQLVWCDRLEQEHDNLRAALEWSRHKRRGEYGDAGLRLASSLFPFWSLRGYWSEGRTWLKPARTSTRATRARAKALLALADLTMRQDGAVAARPLYAASVNLFETLQDRWGISLASSYSLIAENDPIGARALFDKGLALAQALADQWLIANAYHRMGISTFRQGDLSLARSVMEQGLVHARQAGDRWLISSSLVNLGEVLRGNNDYAEAARLYEEGLAIEQELGDRGDSAITLHNMAYIALIQCTLPQAETFFAESLKLHLAGGNRHGVAECLVGLGTVAAAGQRDVRAVRLWGYGDALLKELGQTMEPTDRSEYDHIVDAVHARMGEAAFHVAWKEGCSLTLDQAVAVALARDDGTLPSP